ncbi:MAG: phosphomannomutase/phosphoglucomutase [Clostridia bacterium]|nr:phosphomannomutase/phosphoglucomutase [Clostridia bacterium]
MKDKLKKLKSGTDFRGNAIETDGILDFTDEVCAHIAYGFASFLRNKITNNENLTIAVGHDCRISAERLKNSFIEAILEEGINVIDVGLASTPAMFMTTVNFNCDGAVSITASHHPFNKNGFKFFTGKGGLDSPDLDFIIENSDKTENIEKKGELDNANYMKIYAENLREMICKQVNADDYLRPLRDFKIAVDAGNGVGGFYAKKVLEPLGADVSGSVYLEPDGTFPNHMPNPEDEKAMESLKKAVLESGSDLGVIFDTDVDRAACVFSDGKEINKNALIALMSSIVLKDSPGATIVTDSVTSDELKIFIESLGGKHHRFKRGYKNVINEAKRLNYFESIDSPLAIETSGHAAMRENYFLDDGAYLITKIIIEAALLKKEGKTLMTLLQGFTEPEFAREARIKINKEDFKDYGNSIISELEDYCNQTPEKTIVAKDSHEGVRVSCPSQQGWFLLRLSVHDPILPLNIEGHSEDGIKNMAKFVFEFLNKYEDLNLNKLLELV